MIFKLKFPAASLLANLASPWNVIFPKLYLDKDPNYFKTHVVGSGPFKFKSYTHGATLEGERNPDYFVKDRPYLDGFKFFISTETAVRAAAIRSGRAYIEFRDLPGPEVDAIKKQLGDKVTVQETPVTASWGIAVNNTVKPFNDVRVRKALTLALDRYTMSKVLFPINGLKLLGVGLRPGSEWALPDAELQKREDRPRKCVLHPRALVDAEHGGEGEELRGAAQLLLQPEAPGRLAVGGLVDSEGSDAPFRTSPPRTGRAGEARARARNTKRSAPLLKLRLFSRQAPNDESSGALRSHAPGAAGEVERDDARAAHVPPDFR